MTLPRASYVGMRIRTAPKAGHVARVNWKSVRLELASSPGFPRGSASRAFLLRLPVLSDGSIDGEAIARTPADATVRRFWASEPDMSGQIVRERGHWLLRCAGRSERCEFVLRDDSLAVDRIMSIEGPDRLALPFRVVSMDPVGHRFPIS